MISVTDSKRSTLVGSTPLAILISGLTTPGSKFLEQVKGGSKKQRIISMGDLQDPKMEVLYHIRPYFMGIFPCIGLIYGRYLQSRILKWPLI